MSEPIYLHKNGENLTVYAPRWAQELVRDEGWQYGTLPEDEPEPETVAVDFEIPGYDYMTASEAIELLEESPELADAIRRHEMERDRPRVTVLRALDDAE